MKSNLYSPALINNNVVSLVSYKKAQNKDCFIVTCGKGALVGITDTFLKQLLVQQLYETKHAWWTETNYAVKLHYRVGLSMMVMETVHFMCYIKIYTY